MKQKVARDVENLVDWVLGGVVDVCNEAWARNEDPPRDAIMDMRLARRAKAHVDASRRGRETYRGLVEKGWRPKVPTVIDGESYCLKHEVIHSHHDECDGKHTKVYAWLEKE